MSTGNYLNKLLGALSNLRQVRGEIDEEVNEVKRGQCPFTYACLCVQAMHGCGAGCEPMRETLL